MKIKNETQDTPIKFMGITYYTVANGMTYLPADTAAGLEYATFPCEQAAREFIAVWTEQRKHQPSPVAVETGGTVARDLTEVLLMNIANIDAGEAFDGSCIEGLQEMAREADAQRQTNADALAAVTAQRDALAQAMQGLLEWTSARDGSQEADAFALQNIATEIKAALAK